MLLETRQHLSKVGADRKHNSRLKKVSTLLLLRKETFLTCQTLLDLFLYSYENQFSDKLVKEGKRKLARKFNLSKGYIDDVISVNNKRFNEFISDVYPKELTISETTESTSVASYIDLPFTRDKNNNITTKLYDKRDEFGFHIVNFPVVSSNIPSAPAYMSMHLSSFAMPIVFKL